MACKRGVNIGLAEGYVNFAAVNIRLFDEKYKAMKNYK